MNRIRSPQSQDQSLIDRVIEEEGQGHVFHWWDELSESSQAQLLEQLKNALETGADLKDSLKSTMNEITNQRIVEISAYGKKLAPLAMFYMIAGTIVPSLGAAMLVIASSFINIRITLAVLLGLVGLLVIVQYFFLLLFKAIRPAVVI